MRKKIIITLIILVLAFTFMACTGESKVTPDGEDYSKYKRKSETSLEFFGTTTYMEVAADFKVKEEEDKFNALWDSVKNELRTLDNQINENIETSDINKFNNIKAGETLEINYYTYDLLSKCKELYTLTNGKFNPAVGHLIDLWGFTPRFTSKEYKKEKPYDRENYQNELPSNEYINGFNSLTNYDDVKLDKKDDKYYVTKPNNTIVINNIEYSMRISLGGIGKGYATDVANKLIKEKFNFGYINIGSSSMALNKSVKLYDKKPMYYQVGIGHPRSSRAQYMNIYIMDQSLSTSGDYERYYELDGKRYCHLINADGYPTNTNIATCSVVGKSSAVCDALTTAICCMNINEAIDFLNSDYVKDNELSVYFLHEKDNHLNLYTNADYKLLDWNIKEIKD